MRNEKGQFVVGGTSWLKGTTGVARANKSSFKEGIVPWNKGKKGYHLPTFSLEHRNKLSIARRGISFTEEHREKLSLAKIGKKPWNFSKGTRRIALKIRDCDKYKQWRLRVFRRDSFLCCFCNNPSTTEAPIQADHIRPFSWIIRTYEIKTLEQALECETLWDIKNGRTLCKPCHLSTDTHGIKSLLYVER